MMKTSIASRIAPVALAVAALLPLAAHAHMTWLLPNKAAFDGKEPVASFDAAVSEDLFNFEYSTLGSNTSGSFSMFFDGSDLLVDVFDDFCRSILSRPICSPVGIL